MKTGYGFEQPPGPTFPVEPEPDYLPTIRLFINPAPSPDSKIQKMMRYVAKLFNEGAVVLKHLLSHFNYSFFHVLSVSPMIYQKKIFFPYFMNSLRTLHRTAVFIDGPAPTSVEETGPKTGAMLDSLIQGLIYERQTGNYFSAFLQNSGNEVF